MLMLLMTGLKKRDKEREIGRESSEKEGKRKRMKDFHKVGEGVLLINNVNATDDGFEKKNKRDRERE